MRYLITTSTNQPFLTNWYEFENHFNADLGMVVYDLELEKYTTDGFTWFDIKSDHL